MLKRFFLHHIRKPREHVSLHSPESCAPSSPRLATRSFLPGLTSLSTHAPSYSQTSQATVALPTSWAQPAGPPMISAAISASQEFDSETLRARSVCDSSFNNVERIPGQGW